MPELVLHHYERSPFSEKVRLALGLKGLAYHSVIVPTWMPKPDLVALTGGYRRTPVLQVGADVFCDTAAILRQIDAMHPAPPLYPQGVEGLASALAWWVESASFIPAIGLVRGLSDAPSHTELLEDRRLFFGFSIDKDAMLPQLQVFVQRLTAHLGWLEQMLRDGRDFLLGANPCAADLAAYHPIWFMRSNGGPAVARLLPVLDALRPWYSRVEALGHGTPQDLAPAQALAIAAAAAPTVYRATATPGLQGFEPGANVGVTPEDFGRDTVLGTLVAASADSVVLRRIQAGLGEINVHFPRAGFVVTPAAVAPGGAGG